MRNFFQHQERAHRNTRLLLVLMLLAVLGTGLALYALLIGLSQLNGGMLTSALFAQSGASLLQPRLLLGSLLGTGLLVGGASAWRSLALRGGAQVAETLGGRLVSGQPHDALEKRLLNVVEEMAIASALPVPQVFVLDDEPAINAFAAGLSLGDAVIAVTRGALEKLTRTELQGVIAHEFSHVRNGDMRLNLRLMGIVFGIVCIGLFGRLLLRLSTRRVSSFGRKRSGAALVLLLVGLGVMLVGLIGELFGKLIKAAVSREREYLADASAVQFTRNPEGIAGALKKIGGFSESSRIASERAEEASHFFFADIHTGVSALALAPGLFATHPKLAERIQRIDPSFKGGFPEVAAGVAEPAEAEPQQLGFAPAGGTREFVAGAVVERVGSYDDASLARGQRLLARVPAELRGAVESPFSAVAIVYALLLSDEPATRARQIEQLDALSGAAMRAEALRWHGPLRELPRGLRLPLTELLAPALRALSERQRAALTRSVQSLIEADRSISIFEYVLAENVRARLAGSGAVKVRYKHLQAVHKELALCLSLLAHAAGAGRAERAFAAASARLPGFALSLLPSHERLLFGLAGALSELRALAPTLRAQVIDAAAHGVLADKHCAEDEATLLCAVCDALDCPLPPWAG